MTASVSSSAVLSHFCARRLLLAALLAGTGGAALAQGQPAAAGDRVVVTGSALPVAQRKTGNSLTVIEGEQIRDSGYIYLGDALRQVPGLAVSRTGGFGGPTQARIRGAEGNHTLVLLDGVDISAAGNGETDLTTLLAGGMIDRVEVLRGPQSGLYGSNALAGVINVITRNTIDGHYYDVSTEAGSFDTYQLQGSAGHGAGGAFVAAGGAYHHTNGFDASYVDAGDDEADQNLTLYARGGAELSDALRLDGFVRYVDKSSEMDGFDFSGVPGRQGYAIDDASFSDTRDLNVAGSGALTLLEGRWITVAAASYTDSDSDGGNFGSANSRSNLGLRSSIEFGGDQVRSTLTGFFDSEQESFRNTYPFAPAQIPAQTRDLFGAGIQYRAEIAQQMFLSGALRHDSNDAFEDVETYSLAGAWVVPDSGARPHASFGRGVTNPSFFEQFGFNPGTFAGNPDLLPERAFGWDAGVEQTLADGSVILDATYFSARLEDEIVSCFPSVCNDAGESERQGAEVSARWQPNADFDLLASYTHMDAEDANGADEVRRPKDMASLDANWRFMDRRAALTLGLTYNGEQIDSDFRGGFTAAPTLLDGYTLVRLAGRYRMTDHVELFGRVENLFDTDYEEAVTYATPGQAFYLGVRLTGGSAD